MNRFILVLLYLHPGRIVEDIIMRNDPIIEEIHRIREKYAEKFSFDLDAMFADLKLKEKQSNWRKVVRKPKVFHKKPYAVA